MQVKGFRHGNNFSIRHHCYWQSGGCICKS